MRRSESPEFALKKQTLTAWAQILYKKGYIDYSRLGKMIALIDRLDNSKRKIS
jgi:hypothetical protein